jgi:tetratricopeptide (TPR) repeat protein
MTVTLSLAVDVINRLWGGGPDPLSVVSAVLTLALTGSPLSKRGRELAGWLMDKVHLPTRYRGETMLGAACLAFIVTLLLHLTLPAVAVTCNNRGYALLQAGDLTGAQRAFARAVSINPDYAEAYYNLADAYVEIGDYDQAHSLYTEALAADRTLDLAYNGLGYVLILQGKPELAIPVLYTGLSLARDNDARAALWTNLGRAYLETGRYHEAEAALAQALALNPEEAPAHCTRALTAEALAHLEDEVVLYWENCLRYADPTTSRGQELAAMARVHLQQIEEGR